MVERQRERESAGGLPAAAQLGTELHDQAQEGRTRGGAVEDVVGEAVPDAGGSRQAAWGDGAGVDAAGPVDGRTAGFAEQAPHGGGRQRGEQAHAVDAVALDGGGLAGTEAVQVLHWNGSSASQSAASVASMARTPPGLSTCAEAVAATVKPEYRRVRPYASTGRSNCSCRLANWELRPFDGVEFCR